MKRNQIARTVGFFLMCATICQSVQAASPQKRIGKPLRVAVAKAPRQTYDNNYGSSRGEAPNLKQRGWLGRDVSLQAPVPARGMLIAAGGLLGSTSSMKASLNDPNNKFEVTSKGSSLGPSVGLMYGITEAVFVSGTFNYQPGKSQTETTSSSALIGTSSSTSKDEGLREPEIAVAFTTKTAPGTRIIGELGARIPVGPSTDKGTNGDYSSNGLDGGGALAPRATVVSDLGGVKLVGNLSYRFKLERKTERERSGTTSTSTRTGGNSTEVYAGFELPRAANLGGGLFYSSSEGSTTKSANVESTDDSSRTVAVQAYAGIELAGSNVILMPRAIYLTSLERKVGNVSIDKYDNFIFGLQGIMNF